MDNKKQKVLDVFNELQIPYDLEEHPPLFTCFDREKLGLESRGVEYKNLFLRNKNKSAYYLVSLPVHVRADIKFMQDRLGESRLSFGSEETLLDKLHITTGAVSLLNVIEKETTDVIFVIDDTALQLDEIGFHPNVNTATVYFPPSYIKTIMEKYGAKYRFVNLN